MNKIAKEKGYVIYKFTFIAEPGSDIGLSQKGSWRLAMDDHVETPTLSPPLHNSSQPRDREPSDDLAKIIEWQQQRIARRLRGDYESAVIHLSHLVRPCFSFPSSSPYSVDQLQSRRSSSHRCNQSRRRSQNTSLLSLLSHQPLPRRRPRQAPGPPVHPPHRPSYCPPPQ